MKLIFTVGLFLTLAGIVCGQPLYSPFAPKQEPVKFDVPKVEDEPVSKPVLPEPKKEAPKTYGELRALAVQGNDWMAVVVGNAKAPEGYTLIHRTASWEGDATPRVILCYGAKGELWRHSEVVQRRERRLLPFPFLRGLRQRIAEGRHRAASSWPTELKILDDLEIYDTARMTQKSGNRTGAGANFIVQRAAVGEKWLSPGGLEGVRGWRNVLLRSPENRARYWLGPARPQEWLSEIIHQRHYADGALFADVLIGKDDQIFEVRTAEKREGQWRRRVAYRNEEFFPVGYRPVALSKCAECHDQAGTGGYGVAMIPGGDGILSEPIPALE